MCVCMVGGGGCTYICRHPLREIYFKEVAQFVFICYFLMIKFKLNYVFWAGISQM